MNHDLTPYLETKERFLPVLKYFVQRSIDEQYAEKPHDYSPLSYASFYRLFLPTVTERNTANIYQYSESPIERIFLASLQLLFIKYGMPCLHISPPVKDAEVYIKYYRERFHGINKLIERYKEVTGDTEMLNFDEALAKKQAAGEFTEEQVNEIKSHQVIIPTFEWNSYHLIPQAGLPQVKVNGRSIRCDLLIWVPGDERVKIIVECDGYAYHNSKDSFDNDRTRDRQLQLNGYRVIRFSGSQINKDPTAVTSELFDLLDVIDPNEERVC